MRVPRLCCPPARTRARAGGAPSPSTTCCSRPRSPDARSRAPSPGATSCCWSIPSTAPTCSSSCSARSPSIRARARASCRFSVTSPTCAARRRRSRRTTASCGWPRPTRASSELEQKVREATAELTRQNELLRRSHFEIEQASAAKSQFLANMSHEFRTPLNAILGYTSMLLKGVTGELTSHQRRNLERVDSNAHHLLAIINDILDISRIEAGKMPLTLTTFDLKDLVAEVLAEVEPIITRSQLAVTSQLAADVPQLKTDRQKVKQIVINFLTNAIKFTPRGSVEVRAGSMRDGDQLAIAVADTGIGISAEDRERIFEDFRQADNSPTREYMGAGLGLAICRRLAGMLDGAITLESEIGRGSTFTLVVPREVKRA